MSSSTIVRVPSLKNASRFKEHVHSLGVVIPCDETILTGEDSPLRQPLVRGGYTIANRIAVQPMEGWDGTHEGNPSEATIRRWLHFGLSGAGLIWGGEAVAVSHELMRALVMNVSRDFAHSAFCPSRGVTAESASWKATPGRAAVMLFSMFLNSAALRCENEPPNTSMPPHPAFT